MFLTTTNNNTNNTNNNKRKNIKLHRTTFCLYAYVFMRVGYELMLAFDFLFVYILLAQLFFLLKIPIRIHYHSNV